MLNRLVRKDNTWQTSEAVYKSCRCCLKRREEARSLILIMKQSQKGGKENKMNMGPGITMFSLSILTEHILGSYNDNRTGCSSAQASSVWIQLNINVYLRK